LHLRASGRTFVHVPADSALVDHLVAGTGLTPAEARRVVEDVLDYYAEPVEEFVRRRHAELKTYGAKNADIFVLIAAELRDRVVAAPVLSERQLRRIVYT
jgi:polyhydroxyalkanoate synthesis regulator phasin